MMLLYLFAALMAAAVWAVDLNPDPRADDAHARGLAKATHLAVWHRAASGWYAGSSVSMATTGEIGMADVAAHLPGGSGSALTFTATGLHSAADGAGTLVSWADTADPSERRHASAAAATAPDASVASGAFEAATSTIVNPQVDVAGRVAVPPSLAAGIPDGAPVMLSRFE